MDPLRLHAVAARVVAWHNRHPLARRITVAQVHSVGYVALPYVTPETAGGAPVAVVAEGDGGGSLRERAAARARQQAEGMPAAPPPAQPAVAAPPANVQAAFSEDFIAPLKPRQVARWAARHGRVLAQTPVNGPLREVLADGLQPGHRPLTLYVLTAAIELGDQRHRVLLAGGDDPAVLGRRLISRPRTAAWTLSPAFGLAAVLLLPRLQLPAPKLGASQVAAAHAPGTPAPAHAPAASAPPRAASAAGLAPRFEEPPPPAAELHTVALVAQPASAAAVPAEPHAHPAPTAPRPEVSPAPPLDVEPRLGRIELPPLKLPINDEAKAAARQARLAAQPAASAPTDAVAVATAPAPAPHAPAPAPALARAPAHAGSAPVPAPAPVATAAASLPAPRAVPAMPARGAAFAVSTRTLRTRAEAEQIATAMGALLKDQADLRVDVLPQGDDWRVVGWPFPGAAQADKARALLASRGMRVAVVDF